MSGVTPKETSGPTTRRTAPLIPGPIEGSAVVFIGMIISASVWLIGARWTIDGIVVLYNWFLTFFHASALSPMSPSWDTYGKLFVVPIAFSLVEWFAPFKRTAGVWYFSNTPHWLIWFTVMIFDFYTTYVGIGVTPGNESPTIVRQVATSTVLSVMLAAALTIGPEWIARGMVDLFKAIFGIKRK